MGTGWLGVWVGVGIWMADAYGHGRRGDGYVWCDHFITNVGRHHHVCLEACVVFAFVLVALVEGARVGAEGMRPSSAIDSAVVERRCGSMKTVSCCPPVPKTTTRRRRR